MNRNSLQGLWHRALGFTRELWGEVKGDEETFASGQRERLAGKIEQLYDLPPEEAEHRAEEANWRS